MGVIALSARPSRSDNAGTLPSPERGQSGGRLSPAGRRSSSSTLSPPCRRWFRPRHSAALLECRSAANVAFAERVGRGDHPSPDSSIISSRLLRPHSALIRLPDLPMRRLRYASSSAAVSNHCGLVRPYNHSSSRHCLGTFGVQWQGRIADGRYIVPRNRGACRKCGIIAFEPISRFEGRRFMPAANRRAAVRRRERGYSARPGKDGWRAAEPKTENAHTCQAAIAARMDAAVLAAPSSASAQGHLKLGPCIQFCFRCCLLALAMSGREGKRFQSKPVTFPTVRSRRKSDAAVAGREGPGG